MGSEYFIDNQGNVDEERTRSDVLPDYRFHELLKDDLSGVSIDEALQQDSLSENLRDDRIYLINKNFYHTPQNVDPEIARKVDAGPNGEGRAGDIDVGYIDVHSGELEKIELKSPGRIPPAEERNRMDETFDPIIEGEEQNQYLQRLLRNVEANENVFFPYSSGVEAWRDIVDDGIENIDEIPRYSANGTYVCTPEAREAAEESEVVRKLDHTMFKGFLFGGGEDILEELE